MAEPSSNMLLKIIWGVHFALTSWAMMSSYLPISYMFTHLGVFAFGFWTIVSKESAEAVLMFLASLCFSVINDILLISIYQPRADDHFERRDVAHEYKNEYRWALGMSIVNLILKPVSIFLLYSIFKSRSDGSDFNLSIPGIHTSTGSGQSSSGQAGRGGQYSNIESAQDSHPGVYGRPPYPYQSAPPQQPPPNYDPPKQQPGDQQQVPRA